jgi:DNA uptake protein ComE-like DNA-binding protein
MTMKQYCRSGLLLALVILLAWGLPACSSRSRAQSQSEQDQKTREKVADATAKAKQESEKAAQQLQVAARQAEHEAKVAGQGVKEGWNRNQQGRIDINSASDTDLRSLGLSDSDVQRVIGGRPYKSKQELVSRGILSQADLEHIQGQITVRHPAAPPPSQP